MEEKAKLAELMAEVEFLERRQQAENEAQKMKIEEKLAKAKARFQVFEDMQDSLSWRLDKLQRKLVFHMKQLKSEQA